MSAKPVPSDRAPRRLRRLRFGASRGFAHRHAICLRTLQVTCTAMDAAPTSLDNGEPDGRNATAHSPISADGWPVRGLLYSVPAREGRAVRLRAGETIRIINTHGTQVCDTWAFHAAHLNEFMSMEHVRAWIDRTIPRP